MELNTKILADIFQSNMILPLNKDFKFGGVVDAGETITINFNQDKYQTKADQNSEWQVEINTVSDLKLVASVSVEAGKKDRKYPFW